MTRASRLCAAGLVLVLASSSRGQGACVGSFAAGQFPLCGIDGTVRALAVFDDGSGPALYAGGVLGVAGTARTNGIARWNGSAWTEVGGGIPGEVNALLVHDDGGGPRLFAGGSFSSAGTAIASNVAAWNGNAWSAAGVGVSSSLGPASVNALATYDDGSGPRLYAGGTFNQAGGAPASSLARWNGSGWSAAGSITGTLGLPGVIRALAVYATPAGPRLFVGGAFTAAGGVFATALAAYDGSAFTMPALLTGVPGMPPFTVPLPPEVHAFAVGNLGFGLELFAGGRFVSVSGAPAAHLARFNGTLWSAPAGLPPASLFFGSLPVHALHVHDDGSGPKLHVGGDFLVAGGVATHSLARWDGISTWSALGGGLTGSGLAGTVHALATFDLGAGPALCAAGSFYAAGDAVARSVAAWNGTSWNAIGPGLGTSLDAFAVHDDGTGPALYAANSFALGTTPHPSTVRRWNGSAWVQVGGVFDGRLITDLESVSLPTGTFLCVSGLFTQIGGAPVSSLAIWDGSVWQSVGNPGGDILDFESFDDGSGPQIYAVGHFPGGIARWAGGSWSPVGAGISGGSYPEALTLEVFDDGTGPALYVGGAFSMAGGIPVSNLARWQAGGSWAPVGSGTNGAVFDLQVHRDADAAALFIGGAFSVANGVPAQDLARYGPGGQWTGLQAPAFQTIFRLHSHDDGGGPALYAAGTGTQSFSYATQRYYAFGWTPFGFPDGQVTSFGTFDDGSGPALWLGGRFLSVAGQVSANVARWRRPSPFTLALSQPSGAGSIRIAPACGWPLLSAFTAVSADPLNASQPGGGAWFGLHTTVADLVSQFLTQAPPFVMPLDVGGAALFELPAGALPASLSGTTVWASSHAFYPQTAILAGETPVSSITLH